jgi:spermidine/putrescine transport system substrate-binding protein
VKLHKGIGRNARSCVLASILLVTGLVAAACGGTSTAATPAAPAALTGTVSIFGFQDLLASEILDPFKAAHPGLTVNTAAFGSSDEAATKLQAGFQADVVNVCVRDTQRLVDLGLLQPIDTSRIQGWPTIIPAFKNFVGVKVKGQVYMVPNVAGLAGPIWNPSKLPGGITSFKQLFEDPALKGKVTTIDTAYYSFAAAALALGYKDPYALSDSDIQKVKNYFIAHKSQFRTFYQADSTFVSLMESGEIVGGLGFNAYPPIFTKDHFPSTFQGAQEGTFTWTCGLSITKKTQNVNAAYGVINWYISVVPQTYYVKTYTDMVSDNRTVKTLSATDLAATGLDKPENFAKAIATQIPSNYDKWLQAWQEIKSA